MLLRHVSTGGFFLEAAWSAYFTFKIILGSTDQRINGSTAQRINRPHSSFFLQSLKLSVEKGRERRRNRARWRQSRSQARKWWQRSPCSKPRILRVSSLKRGSLWRRWCLKTWWIPLLPCSQIAGVVERPNHPNGPNTPQARMGRRSSLSNHDTYDPPTVLKVV